MPRRPDPVAPADDAARAQARAMLATARYGALAWTDPKAGTPGISRIAFGLASDGGPVTLVSALTQHAPALAAQPAAAVLLGEPGAKGDPLTHPRLMLRITARFVDRNGPDHEALRASWLSTHPKALLYVDFADFSFVRLVPDSALLNAGFARAFRLTAEDLRTT